MSWLITSTRSLHTNLALILATTTMLTLFGFSTPASAEGLLCGTPYRFSSVFFKKMRSECVTTSTQTAVEIAWKELDGKAAFQLLDTQVKISCVRGYESLLGQFKGIHVRGFAFAGTHFSILNANGRDLCKITDASGGATTYKKFEPGNDSQFVVGDFQANTKPTP